MRADQLLVQRGLAPSRSAAQRLIAQGAVRWRGPAGWAAPRKAGDELPEGCELQIAASRSFSLAEAATAHTEMEAGPRDR